MQTYTRGERKVKIENKTKAVAIAIFLILSMGAAMVLVPSADAHDPAWEIPTYAFIHVSPNPVGVGQTVSVLSWLDKVISGANAENDIRFHDYKLTITDPDDLTDVVTLDVAQDTTSSWYYSFTPSKVGEYIIQRAVQKRRLQCRRSK